MNIILRRPQVIGCTTNNLLKRLSLDEGVAKAKSPNAKSEPKEPERPKKMRKFKIYRYNPESKLHGKKPYMQEYTFDANDCGPMILHALEKIKTEQDSSLAYRKSCREGICGSCGMNINGVNKLACTEKIPKSFKTVIYPLPHMYVIKDLIVDFKHFLEQHKRIRPYLLREDEKFEEGQEYYLQSVKDREKLDGFIECILCACCSTSCPEYWWHGHKKEPQDFLGPAALLNAYRWVVDSRDQGTGKRLDQLRNYFSLFRCTQINNCTKCCPKVPDVDGVMDKEEISKRLKPGQAISRLRKFVAGWSSKGKPEMDGIIKADPMKAARQEQKC